MNSLYDFIVEPIGSRYNNEVNVDGGKLVVNSSIESFKFINNVATVISTPLIYKGNIKAGDTIIIHHNIFRRYYNQKGKAVDSSKLFKENLYFCQEDQVYLYKRDNTWVTNEERCFVAPIKNKDSFSLDKHEKCVGILKIGNSSLESMGVTEGDTIRFKDNREFEFTIDGELLYCMESNDILLNYGKEGFNKGNEIKDN